MNYSTNELENIVFKKDFFYGYNMGQINKILTKIREDYEEFKNENEGLKKNFAIMKETVQHYKTIEESLQHTLIIAQHTSESIKNNATEKASNIIKEAEVTAQKMISEATQQVVKIKQEYEDIKRNMNAYKVKSQHSLLMLMDMMKAPVEDTAE